MSIGDKIQTYRKTLGMSQEELGQKLLVSRQTVSLWEKGQTFPTVDNLIRLKEIFGTSVDDILNVENKGELEKNAPYEIYRFSFSSDEIDEIYRFQKYSLLKKPIIFLVLMVLLFISSIESELIESV